MKQKSQEIIGKTVVNSSGLVIGEVEDYLIDLDTWRVSDIQVKIDKKKAKELGLKVSFFGFGGLLVLIDVGQIQSLTDQVILSLGADEFKDYVESRQAGPDEEEDED